MENKYELIKDDFKEYNGIRCYRIRALRDFGNVKAGDLGGYVSSDGLISHSGECWADTNSVICEVIDWCKILEDAQIFDSVICDSLIQNSKVYHSKLSDCEVQQSTIANCFFYGLEVHRSNLSRITDFSRDLFDLRFHDFHFGFDDFEKSMVFKTQKGRKILFYQDKEGVIRAVVGCKSGITLKEFEKLVYRNTYENYDESEIEFYKDLPLNRKEYLEMIRCAKRIYQLRKEDK